MQIIEFECRIYSSFKSVKKKMNNVKLERENKLPPIYGRYVDDTFALVRDSSAAAAVTHPGPESDRE